MPLQRVKFGAFAKYLMRQGCEQSNARNGALRLWSATLKPSTRELASPGKISERAGLRELKRRERRVPPHPK
jgi:hypothetical protein